MPTELELIIKDRIQKEGPITFKEYMKECLFHPNFGYYTSGVAKIGPNHESELKNIDFATNPETFSPGFGAGIGSIIEQLSSANNGINRIISLGPGDGILDRDILDALKYIDRDAYNNTEYVIVEISKELIKNQKRTLKDHNNVTFLNESAIDFPFKDLEKTVIISNELLDTFPLHKIKLIKDAPKETYVGLNRGDLYEFYDELSDKKINQYFNDCKMLGREYQNGEVILLNTEAIKMFENISNALVSGAIITIDYGQFYKKPKSRIRLFPLKLGDDIFKFPGLQDITADVDFRLLSHICEDEYNLNFKFIAPDLISILHGMQEEKIDTRCHESVYLIRRKAKIDDSYLFMMQTKGEFNVPDKLSDNLFCASEYFRIERTFTADDIDSKAIINIINSKESRIYLRRIVDDYGILKYFIDIDNNLGEIVNKDNNAPALAQVKLELEQDSLYRLNLKSITYKDKKYNNLEITIMVGYEDDARIRHKGSGIAKIIEGFKSKEKEIYQNTISFLKSIKFELPPKYYPEMIDKEIKLYK